MDHLSLVAIGIISFLVIFFVLSAIGKFQQPKFTTVKIGNATVKAEVADTIPKQVRGLMFRESIGKDEGMLFPFSNDAKHRIWMMNMSFPIDIIWLDSKKTIVHIEKRVPPCESLAACPLYTPPKDARYVLEVNAGYSDAKGIKVGTKAELKV
jgi:uncharacterized membrane protein (UPF0127 family)